MSLRRLWFILALTVLPGAAFGHEHNKEEYFAGSYMSGSALWGAHVSFEDTFDRHRKLSWVFLDASGHGNDARADLTALTGIRYSFDAGERFEPSVRLMGGFQGSALSGGQDESAGKLVFGAGVGFVGMITKPATGPYGTKEGKGLRLQVDAIYRGTDVPGANDWHLRVSVGLVIRSYPP